MQNTLIIITGPTGIGKSALSLEVARHFQTEIISADSRQIYKELQIGTAVPDACEMSGINHYFLQTLSIHDYYSAGKFEIDVMALLKKLFKMHQVVIMTGGSMLYIDAICKGIDELPDVDPEFRSSLIKKYETEGIESLRLELHRLDPVYYDRVDLHNPKRMLHALELCLMTGKRYSDLLTQPQKQRPFNIIKIGLNTARETLYSRINNRVDRMMALGLEEEARKVYPFRHVNALNTVGYRELFEYFDGKISLEEAVVQIKAHSRKYARKQLTWFRHDPSIRWFDISESEEVIPFLENELNQGKIK